ncbi:MAG: G1 family glutamic endopeptidase [Streptosporangiaceae bacterium]
MPGLVAALALMVGGTVAAATGASHGTSRPTGHAAALSHPVQAARARASLLRYLSKVRPVADLASDGDLKPSSPNLSAGPRGAAQTGSFNWSGYVDSASPGTFTTVSASWRVHAVVCGQEQRFAAFWVGLDGWNDSTVEQDGTLAYCFEGKPSYYTMWEMFPNNVVVVGSTVAPGDLIKASVTVTGGTSYTLSLTDASNPADSFATTQTCVPAGTCQNSTAEWIAERPVTNIGVSPLASFFHWDVATASQTSDGVPGSISAGPDATQVTMMDGTFSYPLVGISRLSRGGDEFSARWLNSY